MERQLHNGYHICSCGRIWSYKKQDFLKPKPGNYYRVNLYDKGVQTTHLLHRLVAEAYIPNPNNYDTVDHIDGNRFNNCVNNLQWMSRANNTRKGCNKKVKNVETGEIFENFIAAAASVNKDKSGISACIRGKQNTCGGYHWEVIK